MKSKPNNIILRIVVLLCVFASVVSCEHKELCYYHPHLAPVKIKVDWNGFDVTGMTAFLFTKQNMEQKIQTTYMVDNANEIVLDLLEGTYTSAIFNGSEDEFSTLKFEDLGDFDNASVQVTEKPVSWYKSYNVKSNDKYVAEQPEWIASGLSQDITVTKEMVDKAEAEYINGGFSKASRTVTTVDTIAPDSLTCTLFIKVKLLGIDSYHQARAVITGLSIGKYISTGLPLNETVSHYAGAESWVIDNNSISEDGLSGEIDGSITCFGLPPSFKGNKSEIKLTIEILLNDLKTKITHEEPLEIGHLVKAMEGTNNYYMPMAIQFPKVLPYVDPSDGKEGGFGVKLEDWERVEIDILNH